MRRIARLYLNKVAYPFGDTVVLDLVNLNLNNGSLANTAAL